MSSSETTGDVSTANHVTYVFFLFILDPTYGDSLDYVYDKLNVTHSYGLELRPGDDEPNGFLLSDCEIIPTGREIMAALKAIAPILAQEKEADVKDVAGEIQNKKRRQETKRRNQEKRDETRRNEK